MSEKLPTIESDVADGGVVGKEKATASSGKMVETAGFSCLLEQGVFGSPEDGEEFIDKLFKALVKSDLTQQTKHEVSRIWIENAIEASDLNNSQIKSVISRATNQYQLISQEIAEKLLKKFQVQHEQSTSN